MGGLLGHLGAMWGSRGVPMANKGETGSNCSLFWGPIWSPFSSIFRILEVLLQSFFRDCFLPRSGTDFGVVFEVNLGCFWDVVFRFSLTLCTNVKCGLDPLFTVF